MTTNQGTAGQGVGASFTPGPWRVDDRRDASGALQVQAQHRGEGSSYCVASVNFWEAPDANARLIAAAPKMFALLKDCEESFTADDSYAMLREACRKLIAEIGGDA